jgi:hypothetical protein
VGTVWLLGCRPRSPVPTPATPRRPLTVEPRLSPVGGVDVVAEHSVECGLDDLLVIVVV